MRDVTQSDFDIQVAALRDSTAPRYFRGRKSDATPEQWAGKLNSDQAWKEKNRERWREIKRSSYAAARDSDPDGLSKRIKEARGRCRRKDPVAFRERKKRYRQNLRASDPERASRYQRNAYAKRRASGRIGEIRRERRATDLRFRLTEALRGRLRHAIRNGSKSGSAVRDLGCSVAEFERHIESQFEDGMHWGNWSRSGWHIDHIYPLSAADLGDPVQLRAVCNWRNLRPVWSGRNIGKGDSVSAAAAALFESLLSMFRSEVDS